MKKILISIILVILLFGVVFVASSKGVDEKEPKKDNVASKTPVEQEELKKPIEEIPVEPQVNSNYLSLDRSVQETGYYCACACAQATLRFLGIEESQNILAQKMETSSVTGTEYPEFVQVLNSYLKSHSIPASYSLRRVSASEDFETVKAELSNHIKTNIDDGYPVFVMIDVKAAYPELFSGNHMVVIKGYSETNGSIDTVTIMDPSYMVDGSNVVFNLDTIVDAIFKNEEPGFIW